MHTTVCYIEKEGQYLMMCRDKKTKDTNYGKWIGVGGKFENCESPEECMLREVMEETNLEIKSYQYKGIVTFCYENECEYMHLFWTNEFKGEVLSCNEGTLAWIDIDKIDQLNLWEGDRYFLPLLKKDIPFFSMKLVYDKKGLKIVKLNGKMLKDE